METTKTAANQPRKVTKRSSNACTRCRRQKIKCSGLQPCEGCRKRKTTCDFDDKDDKVVVTRAFLLDLQRRVERANRQPSNAGETSQPLPHNQSAADSDASAPPLSGIEHETNQEQYGSPDNDDLTSIEGQRASQPPFTNPLAESPSTFIAASNGKRFYLGTSSNWSFSRKVLQLAHQNVHQAPLASDALLFDGLAYDLGWLGSDGSVAPDMLAIPTPDHAIYLINAVKFHCGHMFHLFENDEFHMRLHQFYADPESTTTTTDLWYIHFLLILAFGKIFIMQKSVGKWPAGAEFFRRALQLLPPAHILCQDAVVGTEILCCIALYLQCIDHRNAAHLYIGDAMRTALCYGMHTDMPVAQLGEEHVQRCRKIWWTVYVLDRQMTSLMGLPQSVRDQDISCQVPIFQESNQRTTTLGMHIQLARVVTEINNNVYGNNGRLNRKFLSSTKECLEVLARLAPDLSQTLPLKLAQAGHGVSRISASMHLLYHQCIVLATRPSIFCFLKMKLEVSSSRTSPAQHSFGNIKNACLESSQQILNILESLESQGLLETFLSLDFDSLYVSAVILVIAPVIDESHTGNHISWVQRCMALFDRLIAAGNLIAAWRKSELQLLYEMVIQILRSHTTFVDPPSQATRAAALQVTDPTISLPADSIIQPFAMNSLGNGDDIIAEQIMAIASSIQDEDIEWMDDAIVENSIW
ncbi:uncharacterized protein JN550_010983 [Neoarthrinium moseri]|uniref:uncharacterized protein n=1 Tax=Neoarthrinium moseri TaxID=1658444 RepID=UPI001FDB5F39|nr:uncharacterized protein JN550_010983 [Neoarthrinium moseri]KAI1861304.1 hypothetical protein JN550_010983 [Neoarthrinium moseri]